MKYVTDDYQIITGEGKEGDVVYKIVNLDSEVVEYEDYLLPRTIDTLMEVQKRLTATRKIFNQPAGLTLVGEENDEQGGLH